MYAEHAEPKHAVSEPPGQSTEGTPCDEEVGELDGDARQYVRHTGMTLPFQALLALPPVLVLKE